MRAIAWRRKASTAGPHRPRFSLRHELIGLAGIVERNALSHPRGTSLGRRLLRLDRREHADDRLHRGGHRGDRRRASTSTGHRRPARRRGRLGVPRDHLRVPHGDGRVGALGGDDRVHVHGAALARDAPRRQRRLRGALRAAPRRPAVRGGGALLRPGAGRRELRGRDSSCSWSRRSRSSASG